MMPPRSVAAEWRDWLTITPPIQKLGWTLKCSFCPTYLGQFGATHAEVDALAIAAGWEVKRFDACHGHCHVCDCRKDAAIHICPGCQARLKEQSQRPPLLHK